jgi:Icc-related predicted phosphoesterase
MKCLHLSDLHGDLPALNAVKEYALKRNDLEFITITGDILGECLTDYQGERLKNAAEYIINRVRTAKDINFTDLLTHLSSSPDVPRAIKEAAEEYGGLINIFIDNAEKQYLKTINLLKQFPQHMLTIPGNGDSIKYFDLFGEYDLHKKSTSIEGIKFAGYGGVNFISKNVPQEAFIDFSEKDLDKFLCEEDADIVLTHVGAKGIQDKGDENKSYGNWAVLAYARAQEPSVIMHGHIHADMGIGKDRYAKTIFINSGNLGYYPTDQSKGTFYEIDADNKGVHLAIPYRIISGQVVEDKTADRIKDSELIKIVRV